MCLNTPGCTSQLDNARSARRVLTGRSALIALSLAASLLIAVRPPARADRFDDKSDRFLKNKRATANAPAWTSAIVQLDGPMTADREQALENAGTTIHHRYPGFNAVAVNIRTKQLTNLTDLPFVLRISDDVAVMKCDAFTVASSGAGAAFQQYGLTGNGMAVAVVDSGVHSHQDLTDANGNSRIIANVNFVPNTTSFDDADGHGTHVAGIIAGNGAASTGPAYSQTIYGIARRTSIVNVRVLDNNGQAAVSTVIAGIQWVITNKNQYNIRILNLSVGHTIGESYATDPLCQACEQAWKAGIVVVCAAGNGGRLNTTNTPGLDNEGWGTAWGSITSPGNDPYVITVGAMKSMDGNRADDRIATYSSRGPSAVDFVMKPDIVAPGNQVNSLRCPGSTLDTLYGSTNILPVSAYMVNPSSSATSQYFTLSGTSMATPVVSGAAALLLEANPKLSPDTVKARLMMSADKWSDPQGHSNPCTYGAGYLNIPAALGATGIVTQYATSPGLYRDAYNNVLVNAQTVLWGTTVIWGLSGVSTTSPTDPGYTIIWGTGNISSSNAISGSTIIWGTGVWVVGDTIIWGTDSAFSMSTAINGEN